MSKLVLHIFLFGLLAVPIWIGSQRSEHAAYSYELKTVPVYCNLPLDTVSVPFPFSFSDFWLGFPLDWMGHNYPSWGWGCGGCIVYSDYPAWNPGGMWQFNFSNPVEIPIKDSLCQDTIKEVPIVEDSLKNLDSVLIMPRKSIKERLLLRFQNMRLFFRKVR
jgi:hypothetical protein